MAEKFEAPQEVTASASVPEVAIAQVKFEAAEPTQFEAVAAPAVQIKDEATEPKTEVVSENIVPAVEPKTETTESKPADDSNEAEDDSNKRQRNRGNFSTSQRAEFRNNIKARFDNLPISCDPIEIRKQTEFYFSDSNLPMDKFLFAQVGGKENRAVPIKLVSSFKRMRRFQPFEAIVAALKESTILDVVDDDMVRRKVPLNVIQQSRDNIRVFEGNAMPRTIYAKGFGEETESTQLDIEMFFESFGPINSVRLRRTNPEKTFKGSVFVEFESEEKAHAFLNVEPKHQWKGEDLLIMSKKAYCEMKVQDIKDGKIEAHQKPFKNNFQSGGRGGRGGRGGSRGGRGRGSSRGGGRGGNRDFDNKRKRTDDDGSGAQAKRAQTTSKENVAAAAST